MIPEEVVPADDLSRYYEMIELMISAVKDYKNAKVAYLTYHIVE